LLLQGTESNQHWFDNGQAPDCPGSPSGQFGCIAADFRS
jgi:hypothetical protein